MTGIGDYDIEISDLVPDNDWYRAEFIVKMSENDYAMAAYSTDRKNWSVIKGTSSEIADKMNLEGPVSNQKVYYAWELDCRNEGLTLEAPEKLEYDKPAEFVLKPNKGYVLPKADDILIQIAGGTVLVNNPGYGSRATGKQASWLFPVSTVMCISWLKEYKQTMTLINIKIPPWNRLVILWMANRT